MVRWAALSLALSLLPGGTASARTITVGPQGEVARPSEAAAIAGDGDVISIAAGVYEGDVATWTANDLTIRGEGGLADIRSGGRAAGGKGVWVIKGDDTTIEHISLSQARSQDFNGAGIRLEGCNLILRDSVLHDNQMGILTDHRGDCSLLIENSEIYNNAQRDLTSPRIGHNVYVGRLGRFVLRGSYVHGALRGHQVKSRAMETIIEYNRISDDEDSAGSYLIDVPEGGSALIIGNLLQQNGMTENDTLVSFGAEKQRPDSELKVLYNTMVNDDRQGVFVRNHTGGVAIVGNNVLAGPGQALVGNGETDGNQALAEPVDENADLTARRWARAVSPPPGGEIPIEEYAGDRHTRERDSVRSVGAFEGVEEVGR